jgi:hypothetical protein
LIVALERSRSCSSITRSTHDDPHHCVPPRLPRRLGLLTPSVGTERTNDTARRVRLRRPSGRSCQACRPSRNPGGFTALTCPLLLLLLLLLWWEGNHAAAHEGRGVSVAERGGRRRPISTGSTNDDGGSDVGKVQEDREYRRTTGVTAEPFQRSPRMASGEHAWLRESTHSFGRTQMHKSLGKSERVRGLPMTSNMLPCRRLRRRFSGKSGIAGLWDAAGGLKRTSPFAPSPLASGGAKGTPSIARCAPQKGIRASKEK